MNKLLIPPSPNWYEADIMACAPDNTLIYGSRQDIIVIKPMPENEPDDVQVITKAHSMRIKSININRNWGQPYKYAVTVSEDKVVKLWNIEPIEKKLSHNKHALQDDDTKVVGASFAGDDRVVSTSESGTVVIWNIINNETTVLSSLLNSKATVTCLSVCPHASWLAAFGLKNGLITVADLRRSGKILYRLRGHDKPVVSLSWCPVPVNIFPVKPNNKVVEKVSELEKIANNKDRSLEIAKNTEELQKDPASDEHKIVLSFTKEILDNPKIEIKEFEGKGDRRKQKNPKKSPNPWVGLIHADDEPRAVVEKTSGENDFLKECADLRQHILKISTPTGKSGVEETPITEKSDEKVAARAILKPKTQRRKHNLSELLPKKEQSLQVKTETDQKNNSENSGNPSEEKLENEAVDTPTDRREISMDISLSVQKLGAKLTSYSEKSMEITTCGEMANTLDELVDDVDKEKVCVKTAACVEGKEPLCDTSELDTTSFSEEGRKGFSSSHNYFSLSPDTLPSSDLSELDTTNFNEESKGLSSLSFKESLSDTSKLDTTSSGEENKKFSSASSCDIDFSCLKKQNPVVKREELQKGDTSSTSESGDVFHDAHVCEFKRNIGSEDCKAEEPVSFEEQPRKEFLLASSAREPNIYIWRAGTDGRMQTLMTVPPVKNQKKTRPDKLWITICWVAPNILLSSSRGAELLQWTLPKPMVQAKFVRQVHKDHWSVLFSVKAPIMYLNEYNFLQKRDISVWTTGMDRMILNTDVGSQRNLACYPSLGGSVNCMSGSPLDPNRLAIGTGEGVLYVWDLSREHTKRVVFSTFYQKIVASVTTLVWHPRIETLIALGTTEGRVGVLDTVGKGKSPKILAHYFKSQIFKLEWGPLKGDIHNLGLYVVSEAKVAIFDPKSQGKEPQLLEVPDNTSVYTLSWKPDYSLLLVSSKSGCLIRYTPDLKISNISYLTQKLQSIIWNPNATSADTSVSIYCRTFVSVVRHTGFVVYDLSIESEDHDKQIIAQFENRGVNINCIEWNPHSGNQLVLVDEGGVAQVYDIETKTILSTFISPVLDSFLTVYWSPIDPDYIVAGVTANKIIIWKVSENPPLTEKDINSKKNKIKAQRKETGDQLVKQKRELAPPEESVVAKPPNKPRKSILPVFYGIKDNTKAQDIRKLLKWKLGDQSVEANIGDGNNIDVLDVFNDQNNMERILNLNISSFRRQGKHHNANLLTLLKGDIGTAVKEAIDQKRVNPWIISMCPMVSPKLWQAACETYANQLIDEPEADPLEIVTYLLACHKVEESVNVLCERAMFREALVLAKARFGADISMVSEILDKWAKNLVYNGNLELAAQCFITTGKFEEAASVLFRRSDIELLELAAELAKLSGNEELHKAVMFRFNAFKTAKDNLKGTSEMANRTSKGGSKEELSEEKDDNEVIGNTAKLCTCKDSTEERNEICDCKENLNNDIKEYLEAQKTLLCKMKEISIVNERDPEKEKTGQSNEVDLKTQNVKETLLDVHESKNDFDSNKKLLEDIGALKISKNPEDNKADKLNNELDVLLNKIRGFFNCEENNPKTKALKNKFNKNNDSIEQLLDKHDVEEIRETKTLQEIANENAEEDSLESKDLKEEHYKEKQNKSDDKPEVVVSRLLEDTSAGVENKFEASNEEHNEEKQSNKIEVNKQILEGKSVGLESKILCREEKQDELNIITEKIGKEQIEESKPKDSEGFDIEFSKKVNEFAAQEVLNSQEGLLSTDEVKELLLKRKMSTEGDVCIKEEGIE